MPNFTFNVWYLENAIRISHLRAKAFDDSGTLVINNEKIEFHSSRRSISIFKEQIRFISKGRILRNKGASVFDKFNPNVYLKVIYSEGSEFLTAAFMDNRALGWAGVLGGTDDIFQTLKQLRYPHISEVDEDLVKVIAKLESLSLSKNATGIKDSSISAATIRKVVDEESVDGDKEIFISYAWGGQSESFAEKIDKAFQAKGITIIRDKRDLGFKGRIKSFMEKIGRGKAIIVIISEKYLKSENCMFELVQISKNGQFYDCIFPIILDDANIYNPAQRIKYIQHWENKIRELDEAMKTVGAANLKGFREDIDLYTEIRSTIAELTNILRDMNSLTPSIHVDSEFEELIRAINSRMFEL